MILNNYYSFHFYNEFLNMDFYCESCFQYKDIDEQACLDPMLCQSCVDADNKKEYELTFGQQ